MMENFTAPDPLNGEALLHELAAAGVAVDGLPRLTGDRLTLDVSESDRAAVQAVLDAHTGEPSPRTVNGPKIRQAAREQMSTLRTIGDSSGDLTNRQLSQAVRVLALGQIHIIRLLLDDLDGTT